MALEKEIATYKAKLDELKQHEGKFVLIQAEEVAGIFSTYEDAIKEGYEKFKLTPFLVKRIQSFETAQHVSRLVFHGHERPRLPR
jgi:hypothetical protein